MNEELLLAYTKFSENLVENVLDINSPQQPPERMSRRAQIFRHQFLTLVRLTHAALQRRHCLAQQCALPLPADQPALAGAEIILGEAHQRRDQLRYPIAAAGRNSEIRPATIRPQATLG